LATQAIAAVVNRVEHAANWDARVEEIRRVPEAFGEAQRAGVYAAVAEAVYKPHLSAQFAYVQWRPEYELDSFRQAYNDAFNFTDGFQNVDSAHLAEVLRRAPATTRVFRSIVGYTPNELAAAASATAEELELGAVGQGRIKSMENGRAPTATVSKVMAETINRLVTGTMWDVAVGELRSKIDKPDTRLGWETVRSMARDGVPYEVLLHQRHYGGAFRTLLDATGAARGEALLEDPVEHLLTQARVPFIKTGAHNQGEIADRFALTVRPAPDFLVYEGDRTLLGLIESKQANDGGTARDKAGRFDGLRREGQRLGGVPVFAVLDGLGWERTGDALGPVVRYTDGRVFSLATLPQMLTVQPFPRLIGTA
jgi:hypothetical protein